MAPGRYSEQPPIGIGERTPDCLAAFPDDLSPRTVRQHPFAHSVVLPTGRGHHLPEIAALRRDQSFRLGLLLTADCGKGSV